MVCNIQFESFELGGSQVNDYSGSTPLLRRLQLQVSRVSNHVRQGSGRGQGIATDVVLAAVVLRRGGPVVVAVVGGLDDAPGQIRFVRTQRLQVVVRMMVMSGAVRVELGTIIGAHQMTRVEVLCAKELVGVSLRGRRRM